LAWKTRGKKWYAPAASEPLFAGAGVGQTGEVATCFST